MVVDDRIRLQIHHKLEALIGTEEADALVAHALPAPGQEVATKDDLRVLSAELRGEMEKLRGEMEKLRGEIRGEIEQLRGEMTGEFGSVRGEIGSVRGEIGSVRGDLRAELHNALASQTRWMIGFIMSWSAVVLAAARLLF